jgi:hypothetical protein
MSAKNRKNCENLPDDRSLTTTTHNSEPSVRLYWGYESPVGLTNPGNQ